MNPKDYEFEDNVARKCKDMMDWENRKLKTHIESNSLSVRNALELGQENRNNLKKLKAQCVQLQDILKQLYTAHDKTRQELEKLKRGRKTDISSGVMD
jgi:hypothetical protein